MKNAGGKDTVLLFVVLLLALGAVCYLCVIKKNLDNLSDVNAELEMVEQEKFRNDEIIKQADELDSQKKDLVEKIGELEQKLLPDLNTASIQRQIYEHFKTKNIPFIVKVENTDLNYETVTLPNGTVSPDRVKWSSYKIRVSGTDGFLLTHDEGDQIDDEVFYNQLFIQPGDTKTQNQAALNYAKKSGMDIKNANDLHSSTVVGYNEFVAALKEIEDENLGYVKITDIEVEDMGQGYCEFTAAVDVFAYDLVNRKSTPNNSLTYMGWVGDKDIKVGGLVGLPSYFFIHSDNYDVPEDSPLYMCYLSFVSYDFNVNRPFAAWNHWSYEWQLFDELKSELDTMPPATRSLTVRYRMGMISTEDYNKAMQEYQKTLAGNQATPEETTPTDTERP